MSSGGWTGVDLDGTLAEYKGWRGTDHIGAPVRRMRIRVVQWLHEGEDVRIFTARTEASYPAIRRLKPLPPPSDTRTSGTRGARRPGGGQVSRRSPFRCSLTRR